MDKTISIDGITMPLYSLDKETVQQIFNKENASENDHFAFAHESSTIAFVFATTGDPFIYAAHKETGTDIFTSCSLPSEFCMVLVDVYKDESLSLLKTAFSGLERTHYFADSFINGDAEVSLVLAESIQK